MIVSDFNIFHVYLKSTGAFYAAARYGSATPVPPHVISRGAGWVVRSTCTYFVILSGT